MINIEPRLFFDDDDDDIATVSPSFASAQDKHITSDNDMEALIYNDSPLAEYLEGSGLPEEQKEPQASLVHDSPTFAPRGLPKLRARLRNIRQNASSVTDSSNEQFLERFHYVIVASQLLSDEPKAGRQIQQDTVSTTSQFSIKAASVTAGISYSIAWLLHLLRRKYSSERPLANSWADLLVYTLVCIGGCTILLWQARRQYLRFVREYAGSGLAQAVSQANNFDGVASEALRFIQEVEIVSRGYEISQPLPPVSRLEDNSSLIRCRELRECLGNALTASIVRWVEAHNSIGLFVRDVDLRRYHDIYEVSMQDYSDAVAFANQTPMDGRGSLRELRFLSRLNLVARKVFLCDMLALRTGSTWRNISQWRLVSSLLGSIRGDLSDSSFQLHSVIVQEQYGEESENQPIAHTGDDCEKSTPHKRHTRAQMRRFESVANAVRSLNAKIHLLREEISSIQPNDDASVSMAITGHYEQLGTEIRHLLVEWEKGRNTMFLNTGTDSDRRLSRTSSGIRTPGSPSPSSLGGLTVVDGGPAEALKLLSGEERSSSDGVCLDEEVFEAVSLPRKRMSWTPLTREEKLHKLQEDRRKRATLQEQADNTTNMLRELQMVIKHRPLTRSDTRITSI
jgi:hypothetical protein